MGVCAHTDAADEDDDDDDDDDDDGNDDKMVLLHMDAFVLYGNVKDTLTECRHAGFCIKALWHFDRRGG